MSHRLHRWVPKYEELDESGYETFIQEGVKSTVRKDTDSKYTGAGERYVAFIKARGLPYGYDSFVAFLHACRKQGASAQTLEGYRAAMVWLQRMFDADQWAANPLLARALKGYKYADKLTRPPRGAILEPMLLQLQERHPGLAIPAATTFYCVLRRAQTERLRAGDIQCFEDGRVVLTLRADKRANANNSRQLVTRKEVVLPKGQFLLRELATRRRTWHKLFPNFKAEDLDRAIAETARAAGWPAKLVYDGMHCLRHGGASALRSFLSGLLASMGDPAAMSAATAAWYSRMNTIRVDAEAEEAEALMEEGEGEEEEEGGTN